MHLPPEDMDGNGSVRTCFIPAFAQLLRHIENDCDRQNVKGARDIEQFFPCVGLNICRIGDGEQSVFKAHRKDKMKELEGIA